MLRACFFFKKKHEKNKTPSAKNPQAAYLVVKKNCPGTMCIYVYIYTVYRYIYIYLRCAWKLGGSWLLRVLFRDRFSLQIAQKRKAPMYNLAPKKRWFKKWTPKKSRSSPKNNSKIFIQKKWFQSSPTSSKVLQLHPKFFNFICVDDFSHCFFAYDSSWLFALLTLAEILISNQSFPAKRSSVQMPQCHRIPSISSIKQKYMTLNLVSFCIYCIYI